MHYVNSKKLSIFSKINISFISTFSIIYHKGYSGWLKFKTEYNTGLFESFQIILKNSDLFKVFTILWLKYKLSLNLMLKFYIFIRYFT